MHQLLRDEGFWVALAVALGCSIVIVVVRRPSRFVGLQAGAAAAIGAVVALLDTDRRGMLSFIGLALVVVGAALGRRLPGRWALIAAAPGAAVIALALDATVPDWAAVTLFGAIVVVAPCAIATDVRAPRVLPILLAITAAGMWATTPDTEHTRVLLGAVAGSVVLVLDRRLRAGAGGTAAVVAL